MDLIVSIYPLYVTYCFYTNTNDHSNNIERAQSNEQFVTTWWTTFGLLTLLEKYSGFGSFPYIKNGCLFIIYSDEYRRKLVDITLNTIHFFVSHVKTRCVRTINEYYQSTFQKAPPTNEVQVHIIRRLASFLNIK